MWHLRIADRPRHDRDYKPTLSRPARPTHSDSPSNARPWVPRPELGKSLASLAHVKLLCGDMVWQSVARTILNFLVNVTTFFNASRRPLRATSAPGWGSAYIVSPPPRSAPDRREPHADALHVPSYCNSSTRRRRRHNMKKSTSPTRLSTTGAACSAACCRARGLYGMSARSPRTRHTDCHYIAPTSRRQRPRNAQSWTCRSGS